MKEILLTKGKVALVDDEDFERLAKFKWCADKSKTGQFYARRTIATPKGQRGIFMQWLILNRLKGLFIDHINCVGLDNRKANLRLCTPAQNQYNQFRGRGSSKYKGVSFHNNGWQAQIKFKQAIYYLGRFKTEVEAAKAYGQKAIELFGKFARPNLLKLEIAP